MWQRVVKVVVWPIDQVQVVDVMPVEIVVGFGQRFISSSIELAPSVRRRVTVVQLTVQ